MCDVLDEEQVRRVVGGDIDWYRSAGELIELHDEGGIRWFPGFQFDQDRGRVHPIVAYANRRLGAAADPEAMLDWWNTQNQHFCERSPIDLLEAGKLTRMAVDNVVASYGMGM
ncbi:hypothetical protein RE9425_03190 [Prescottella equi]|nr:hypothetical protein RE9425_03190 [Prescottella equi]